MSVQQHPSAHWKGQEPLNSRVALTPCTGESRGARRCQLNGSIGALERRLRSSFTASRTYCPPSRAKQSHGARRASMSVQRFHRGIGASEWGKYTHGVRRRVRVNVTVGERHLSVVDVHTTSLPTKGSARFRSVRERASIGALEWGEPFNSWPTLTPCAGESRGAR